MNKNSSRTHGTAMEISTLKEKITAAADEMARTGRLLRSAGAFSQSENVLDETTDRIFTKAAVKAEELAKNLEAIADFGDTVSDTISALSKLYQRTDMDTTLAVIRHALEAAERLYEEQGIAKVTREAEGEEQTVYCEVPYKAALSEIRSLRSFLALRYGLVDPTRGMAQDYVRYLLAKRNIMRTYTEMLAETADERDMSDTAYLKAMNVLSAGITASDMLSERAREKAKDNGRCEAETAWKEFARSEIAVEAKKIVLAAEEYCEEAYRM